MILLPDDILFSIIEAQKQDPNIASDDASAVKPKKKAKAKFLQNLIQRDKKLLGGYTKKYFEELYKIYFNTFPKEWDRINRVILGSSFFHASNQQKEVPDISKAFEDDEADLEADTQEDGVEKEKSFFDKIVSAIKSLMGKALKSILKWIFNGNPLVKSIKKKLIKKTLELAVRGIKGFARITANIFKRITNFFVQRLGNICRNIGNKVKEPIANIAKWIRAQYNTVKNWLQSLSGKGTGKVVKYVKKLWRGIKKVAKFATKVLRKVGSFVKKAFNKLKRIIKKGWSIVKKIAKKLLTMVIKVAKKVVEKATSKSFMKVLKLMLKWLIRFGVNMLSNICIGSVLASPFGLFIKAANYAWEIYDYYQMFFGKDDDENIDVLDELEDGVDDDDDDLDEDEDEAEDKFGIKEKSKKKKDFNVKQAQVYQAEFDESGMLIMGKGEDRHSDDITKALYDSGDQKFQIFGALYEFYQLTFRWLEGMEKFGIAGITKLVQIVNEYNKTLNDILYEYLTYNEKLWRDYAKNVKFGYDIMDFRNRSDIDWKMDREKTLAAVNARIGVDATKIDWQNSSYDLLRLLKGKNPLEIKRRLLTDDERIAEAKNTEIIMVPYKKRRHPKRPDYKPDERIAYVDKWVTDRIRIFGDSPSELTLRMNLGSKYKTSLKYKGGILFSSDTEKIEYPDNEIEGFKSYKYLKRGDFIEEDINDFNKADYEEYADKKVDKKLIFNAEELYITYNNKNNKKLKEHYKRRNNLYQISNRWLWIKDCVPTRN